MTKGFREVTALSALSTIIRLSVMFFLNKITAVLLGPSGFAVIGHIQNIFNISQSVGGKSLQTGIVRFASQEQLKEPVSDHFRAAVIISLVGSILTGAIIIGAHALVPYGCTEQITYQWVVPLIPLSIFATSLTIIVLAHLQGTERFRRWFLFTLVTLTIQVIVSLIALKLAGLIGLVSAMIALPVIQMVAILFFMKNQLINFILPLPSKKSLFSMNEYLLMGIVSIGVTPLVQVVIRTTLIDQCGIDQAGLWQGVLKLGELGVLLVVSTLSTWYLPRLAKAKTDEENGKVLLFYGTVVLIAGFAGMIAGAIGGKSILSLVFSDSFRDASPYLNWQLGIVIIQLLSWAFGSYFLIKGNVKEFVVLELIGQAITVVLALLLIPHCGVMGIFYSFLIEGVLYLAYLIFRLRHCFIAGAKSLRREAE